MPERDMPKRSTVLDASPEDAKGAGEKLAIFAVAFKAKALNLGVKEEDLNNLLKEAAASGSCSSGTMCGFWT